MKQNLFLLFILSASLSYSQSSPSEKSPINADSLLQKLMKNNNKDILGKQYPEFQVTVNNKEYSSASLKGKTVFINFWFAACAPCVAEFDELNTLFEKFGQNKNFEFVSFTFENSEQIDAVKKKYNIKYNIFSIPKPECYRLNFSNGFPTNVIIDPSGSVTYIHSGGPLEKPRIKKDFDDTVYPLISKELNLN
jgi:peroxiredoxin